MKTILVTGGAGFVGSHLCKRILDRGDQVICLDNLSTGLEQNLHSLAEYEHFSFLKHDLVDPIDLKVDEIYNLACPASPIHYQKDAIKTTKTCVIGIINMLELAKKNQAKILHASTSEVYGDPKMHPQPEYYRGEVNPIGIRACYDEGKRCAESLCFDYHRQYGVEIRIVRIFNTYGPNMDRYDGRVVSNFIVQALQDKDITIYGDGSQTRSFCYIDDLVDGMIALMDNKNGFCGPVNMGNPSEFTIKDFAQLVIDTTQSKSKITFHPLPQDDPLQRKPDISLAYEKLGWKPKISIEKGLIPTIQYFKDLLHR